MLFNFKKNNLLIILLLILVVASSICYCTILNNKEDFSNYKNFFKQVPNSSDTSYNYWTLNDSTTKYYPKQTDLTSMADYSLDVSNSSISNSLGEFMITNKYNVVITTNNTYKTFLKLKNPTVSSMIHLDVSSNGQNNKPINVLLRQGKNTDNSNNIYDFSNTLLNINLKISNTDVVQNGKIRTIPTTEAGAAATADTAATATTAATAATAATASATEKKTGAKDSNKLETQLYSALLKFNKSNNSNTDSASSPFYNNELHSYMLPTSSSGDTNMLSNYLAPNYNNKFETAMNLSSNPIVNPINSMNPLQYSESLFGPNVTPSMAKNAHLNSGSNYDKLNQTDKKSTSSMNSAGVGSNMLTQNDDDNSQPQCNNITVDDKLLKQKCQPCPACERCPESNFDCKKIPNYEQGQTNTFLPRPVLNDFSTFGM